MAKKNHTHKFHKIEVSDNKIWSCALPDCTYNVPKHYENLVIGKYSICWQCGDDKMILGPDNQDMDFPICLDCQSGIAKEKTTEPLHYNLANLSDILKSK